ncbi:MAG: hypothetical protein RR844_07220 [Clostridium sp.]
MGFIWRLVKSDLKENKIKNLLSGITITLTAILLTSVFMVCVNWGKVDELMAIENTGQYHGIYK